MEGTEIEAAEELARMDVKEIYKTLDYEESSTGIRFVKNKGGKNLGKIIVGKQQFICNKQQGSRHYYDCARKHEGKSPGSSCKATVIIETNELRDNIKIIKMFELTDHNHVCEMGRVVKWLLYEQLEEEFLCDLEQKPSNVRKRVVGRFKEEYTNQPHVWNEVESFMAKDLNID